MTDRVNIDHELINQELEHILQSRKFNKSIILAEFLRFIVSETLHGHENQLKEWVIATEVLKRKPDFNPQYDAIVRIHGTRLRKALDIYYQKEGINSPLRITVPKGRYIPEFEIYQTSQTPDPRPKPKPQSVKLEKLKPTIGILPFECDSGYEVAMVTCDALRQELNMELTKFPELQVVSTVAMHFAIERFKTLEEIYSCIGAHYTLSGNCRTQGELMRITISLDDIEKNHLIWSETFTINGITGERLLGYRSIVSKVIGRTCGFLGLITQDMVKNDIPEDSSYLYAIYWHTKYHQNYSEQSMREALGAMDIGIAKNPECGLLYALKAELLLNLQVFKKKDDPTDYLKIGTQLAHKSVQLDHACQLGWQNICWSNVLYHDKKGFLKNAQISIALNPNNMLHIGAIGCAYIMVGEYDQGLKLISESMEINPVHPWFYNVCTSFYYLHDGDFEEALYWVKKMNQPEFLGDAILRCATSALANQPEQAALAAKDVLALAPDITEHAKLFLGVFLHDKSLIDTILNGLTLAGLKIERNTDRKVLPISGFKISRRG
jgi:TolB-like protein/tetratricopeptide (TPR) repeat protein